MPCLQVAYFQFDKGLPNAVAFRDFMITYSQVPARKKEYPRSIAD